MSKPVPARWRHGRRAVRALAAALSLIVLAFVAPSSPSARADGDPAAADLRAALDEVRPVVAELRGLAWKREVRIEFARGPLPNPRWTGFYEWGSDTVTVIERNRATLPFLLAHELTHALQDQHYDLAAARKGAAGGDASLALSAALEGEAHLVAVAYALRRFGLARAFTPENLPDLGQLGMLGSRLGQALGFRHPPPAGTPPAERDSFVFPYTHGLSFAQAVVRARGRGLRGLDGVLLDPPRSTEQVLHPEKYLAGERDDPVPVAMPVAPGPGWRRVEAGTRGEWGTRAELESRLPRAQARAAAAGWGGDAYAVYERGGARVLLWETVWDTDDDADGFAAAYDAYARAAGRGADIVRDAPCHALVRDPAEE